MYLSVHDYENVYPLSIVERVLMKKQETHVMRFRYFLKNSAT